MWRKVACLLHVLLFSVVLHAQHGSRPALRTSGKSNPAPAAHHTAFSQQPVVTDTIVFQKEASFRTRHTMNVPAPQALPEPAPRQERLQQKPDTPPSAGDPLTLTTQVTNSTCENMNGIIIATASGGTPPYQFAIGNNDYSNLGAYTTVIAGTYTIHVRDANGQTASTEVTVTNTYTRPGFSFISRVNPSNCTSFDGSISFTGTGGQPPYMYSKDRVNYQGSGTFTNLPQNWFEYEIKDANGCIGYATLFGLYAPFCRLGFAIAAGAPDCSATGSASLSATGGTPPYQYSTDGIHYQDDGNLTNLPLGINVLYAKDANNDTVAYAQQIFGYCGIKMQANVTDIPCYNPNNIRGSVVVTAVNGTEPYEYTIDGSHYQQSNRFDNLPFGTYSILARDAKGAFGAITVQVKGGCLNMTVEPVAAGCDGKGGSIIVHANGGNPPYRYTIDGVHYQDDPAFTGVAPGIYTVTAKDADGLTVSQEGIEITASGGASITGISTTPATCPGNDGTLAIQASGAPPPQYSIDGTNWQSTGLFNGLNGGSYTAYVKDGNGCTSSRCCGVVALHCLTATAATGAATCSHADGSLTVTAAGGTPPYRYSIDGAAFQDSPAFTGLLPGAVTVTVRDADGFTTTVPATVPRVCITLELTPTNPICGNANGMIAAVATGGTAPYTYAFNTSSFSNVNVFLSLGPAQYTIRAKDANGFVQTATVTLTGSNAPRLGVTMSAAGCADNDGSITATVTGGTAPFVYRVDGQPESAGAATAVFPALSSGLHTVQVTDGGGCTTTVTAEVSLTAALTVDAGSDVTLCEGAATTLQASGSVATAFRWQPAGGLSDPLSATPAAAPPVTTKYYLYASTAVCSAVDSVVVTVLPAPVANAGGDVSVCYGKPVFLSGSGGIAYRWQPAAYLSDATAAAPLAHSPAGTTVYVLEVTDGQGCTSLAGDTMLVHVAAPAKVFAGADTIVSTAQPVPLHAQDVNNSGFTTYLWQPPAGLSNAGIANPIATVTEKTRYTVTASTPAGCTGTDDIVLTPFAGPDIYVPGAFTPNGDGHNDVAHPVPVGIVSLLWFSVYDRFGHLVFTTQKMWEGWDGTVHGQPQNTGTYVWMAAGLDVTHHRLEKKGTLVLMR